MVEGALQAQENIIQCDYCGYNHHAKECRFYERDKANGELKPNG
jgi:hypothetical protein